MEPWLKIDDWYDILIAGLMILAMVGMILAFVEKGGRFKLGKDGAEITDDGATGELREPDDCAEPCAPFQEEHSAILVKLTEAVQELREIARNQAQTTRGIDVMQRAELFSIDVLLGRASGEEDPQKIIKARLALSEAQGFKSAVTAEQVSS